eukprot:TRINITY_DN102144_c0_g1_i1.p1 TRINITY_DN102144_c0_g1~~TRINITY_DN102144_c0_g1_i1.p1  ORF type:complete len:549 (-),score=82.31 TRINITY_DN102144_c0_g1_i1:16-1437(-)
MPSVACSAFAAQPLPVIHLLPAPIPVQIPQFSHATYLRSFIKLAQNPKNHVVANTHYVRLEAEHATGLRLPVIPALGLHIKVQYSGWSSRDILLNDRYGLTRMYAWCSSMVDKYPFRLVDLQQTDRRFETFAKHFAMVLMPYAIEGQYIFYEMYAIGIPMFVPADPSWFLWPRISVMKSGTDIFQHSMLQDLYHRCPKGERKFQHFVGKHEYLLKGYQKFPGGPKKQIMINYTIFCSGRVSIQVENYDTLNGTQASETAQLVEMDAMDERGQTHALRPVRGRYLKSHGGHCVRLKAPIQNVRHVRIFVGPSPEETEVFARAGACESGPLYTLDKGWARGYYVRETSQALLPPFFVDSFERKHHGGTNWIFGTALQRRRRRRALRYSPMELGSLRALRSVWPASPYAVYPHLGYFASAAELLKLLLELEPKQVSRDMRRFLEERREAGLEAWRNILEEVNWHPSQEEAISCCAR